jgi:CRP-like cAMP-binding protein
MGIVDFLTDATVVFFFANTLYVVSYMLTSMLWLRILAIVAAASTFPYFYFQAEPLWSALFWQSCFLLVNLVNLLVLLYSMRSTRFEEDEAIAYELKFSDLKPHEVRKIFRYADSRSLLDGEAVLEEGVPNSTLHLVLAGECVVLKHQREVARLGPGQLVGELSFLSGEETSASVWAHGDVRLMAWDRQALQPLFKKQGLYESYFNAMCSLDVAGKLRALTHRHAAESIS